MISAANSDRADMQTRCFPSPRIGFATYVPPQNDHECIAAVVTRTTSAINGRLAAAEMFLSRREHHRLMPPFAASNQNSAHPLPAFRHDRGSRSPRQARALFQHLRLSAGLGDATILQFADRFPYLMASEHQPPIFSPVAPAARSAKRRHQIQDTDAHPLPGADAPILMLLRGVAVQSAAPR